MQWIIALNAFILPRNDKRRLESMVFMKLEKGKKVPSLQGVQQWQKTN